MNHQVCDLQHRLDFIERTIDHAARACVDKQTPAELRRCIEQLGIHSSKARCALEAHDDDAIRTHLDELARASDRAQGAIAPDGNLDFALKSAVILAHIEVSALKLQV